MLLTSSSAGTYTTANQQADWSGLLPAPPVVTRTFSPSDTLTWFAVVYYNTSPLAHAINYPTSVPAARAGRTLRTSRDNRVIQAGSRGIAQGFTTSLPLRDLMPGMYVLHVEASATGSTQTASRDVLFEVK